MDIKWNHSPLGDSPITRTENAAPLMKSLCTMKAINERSVRWYLHRYLAWLDAGWSETLPTRIKHLTIDSHLISHVEPQLFHQTISHVELHIFPNRVRLITRGDSRGSGGDSHSCPLRCVAFFENVLILLTSRYILHTWKAPRSLYIVSFSFPALEKTWLRPYSQSSVSINHRSNYKFG